MTPIQISTESWHYKFLAKFWYPSLCKCSDICSYTRTLILGILIIVLLFLVATGMIGFVVGDTLAWLAACFTMGSFIEAGTGPMVLATFSGFAVLMVLIFSYCDWRDRMMFSDPGPISQMYMSWKNKYCQRISFTRPE